MRGQLDAQTGKLSRKDPAVAGIIRAWRRLTTAQDSPRAGAGEPTLIACSGGADSCALLLSLALVGRCRFVVGHVLHDMRPRVEVEQDRESVKALAERLGVEFVETEVSVWGGKGDTNMEAAARRARYAALSGMARQRGIRFVATAHHAEDQLETVLMSLLRGTGGTGVRGLAVSRVLSGDGAEAIHLIRPMASEWCGVLIDRAMCQRLCRDADIQWREDATNLDTTRLRNALRKQVVPVLRELRPDVLAKAAAASGHARAVGQMLTREATRIIMTATRQEDSFVWARETLRAEPIVVIAVTLRQVRGKLCGPAKADRITKRGMDAILRAIRDRSTDPREFVLGGMVVRVTAREVRMSSVHP